MSTDLSVLFPRLSAERTAPYLKSCSGDHAAAIRLYEWNILASGAFFETLQAFEVILRNALAERLADWHGQRPGAWCDDPRGVFDQRTRADLDKAIERIHEQRRPVTAGRVVAELSFGRGRSKPAVRRERALVG